MRLFLPKVRTSFHTASGLLLLSLAACSGEVEEQAVDAGAGSQGQAPGSSESSSWSPVCPENAPTLGSACTLAPDAGITCEYGTIQVNVACDTVFLCMAGTWSDFQDQNDGSLTCVADGANAASCPAAYDDVRQGSRCSDDAPLQCEYAEGVCGCEWGGSPNGNVWNCDPGPGCPYPRPRLGSACSGSMDCEYEECAYDQYCEGGIWIGNFDGCD